MLGIIEVTAVDELSEFLALVEGQLHAQGLRASRQVKVQGGPKVDLIGSRTYFSWKGLVLLSRHILVRSMESATRADAEDLFDVGFRYGKKGNRVPLLRGLQFGYMVIPCLAVRHADEGLIRYVESRPRKHWAIFEFPVVVDFKARAVYYYRKTAMWGAFFFSDMRYLVESVIAKALVPAGRVAGANRPIE